MRRMAICVGMSCALGWGATASATIISETFETYTPGTLPGGAWRDIAGSITNPTVPSPTGSVIETAGADGAGTRAFQISRLRGTSQGIIADIEVADMHRLEADVRIDAHPTPVFYGDWNASIGFIQDRGIAPDINENPQGVVYVYDGRWRFFGATVFGGNAIDVLLSDAPVVAGEWYHVRLDADTTDGSFDVLIRGATGGAEIERSLSIPNWNPLLGRYDRIAAFDGDYSGQANLSGQFTIDNVVYVPSPGVAMILALGMMVGGRRRIYVKIG